jgi:outer membrane murein-binding lipoprotein Lpp
MEPSPRYISSVFELIAGYIASKFYNVLYSMAKASASSGQADSTTAAYSVILSHFEKSITSKQTFEHEVKQLQEFVRSKAPTFNISFRAFQTQVLCCFVPPQYLRDMTEAEKDTWFAEIIGGAIKSTCKYVRNKGQMRLIIDDRANGSIHSRGLQEHVMGLLAGDRVNIYRKFIKEEAMPQGAEREIAQIQQAANAEIKRRNAIIMELTTRLDAASKYEEQLQAANMLVRQLQADLANVAADAEANAAASAERIRQLSAAAAATATKAGGDDSQKVAELSRQVAELNAKNAELSRQNADKSAEILALQTENDKLNADLARCAVPIEPNGRPEKQKKPAKTLADLVDDYSEESSGEDFDPEALNRLQREKFGIN